MGNKAAREKWVTDEFNSIIDAKRKKNIPEEEFTNKDSKGKSIEYLTLNDIHNFKQPRNRDIQLDSTHLGTLFVIDKSKDGRFYKDELIEFVHLYFDRQLRKPGTVDVVKEFQGYCTLQLWNYVNRPNGKVNFVKWFGDLLSNGNVVKIKNQDKIYVGRGAVKSLHEIFSITKSYGVEQSTSFTTMQTVAVQKKMIDNPREKLELKDVLPKEILEEFGSEFISGFMSYMKELGFEPDMDIS